MTTKLRLGLLYLISFFDTLCFGLIMPVLPPYILTLGGNHKILGILGTLHMLLQLFSVPFARNCSDKYGKRTSLMITLLVGLLTNVLMGIVTKYLSVIIIRLIFYLTNQTQTICKAFVADYVLKEKHTSVYSTMSLLGVLGFVVGPIIGGYLFDMENGFYYISLTTFVLSLLSILLSMLLPYDRSATEKRTTNLAERLAESLTSSFQSLYNVQYRSHWKIILMKILSTASLTAFFIKFSLLLRVHYKVNNTLIGYTVAYQSVLVFLCSFLVPFGDKIYGDQYIKKLLHSLSLLTISVANVCYAPTYTMYLIFFIPMSAAKCIFDSAWRNMTVAMKSANKQTENITSTLDTFSTLTSIVTPVIFGYACELYTHNAVKGFSILPLAVAMFLLHFTSKKQVINSKQS